MSAANVLSIGDFCKTGSGGTPSRAKLDRYYSGGTIPWVKSGELREGIILETDERVTHLALEETSIKLVPKGAILLAMYGATVGRLALLGVEATTNQAVCHIVPDPKIADTSYIFHALASQVPAIIAMGVGGAQPNISQGIVRSLNIWLPSIDSQRRIAAILDQATNLKTKRQDTLIQLDKLTRSIFFEMFGDYLNEKIRWPLVPFESLVKDSLIGMVRSAEEFGPDLDIPYVRMNAIGPNGEYFPDRVQRTNADSKEIEKYSLRSGDFLFNTRNSKELVGKTALFREHGLALFNNNLMRIRVLPDIEPEYMAAAFLTPYVQRELEQRKSGTTSVFAIYGRDLNTLLIPVPPKHLQREFGKRVGAIEEIKNKRRGSMQESDCLFASLQYRAFSGKL